VSGKLRGYLEVPGTAVRIPYTRLEGKAPGMRLLVTGGVHGGEYPGIEAAIRLAGRLDPDRLRGLVTVIHLANPPAFYSKTQYVVPLDGKNLNRAFPGNPGGSPTERMAHAVFEVARTHDAWIDLHGGDIHEALLPFVIYSAEGGPVVARRAKVMAEAYGIPTLVESDAIEGAGYAVAARHRLAAILAEAGQVGQLDETSVVRHVDGVFRVLVALGMLAAPDAVTPPAEAVDVYTRNLWVRAPVDGFQYPAVRVGDTVREGQICCRIRNEWGELQAECAAPAQGRVLFHATSLAINAGDPLFAVIAR